MLESYTISDVKQLKALGHATRVKILAALAEKPMTAKQLADAFGEGPAKTSYHVKQLLKVGLVELKFTRETQNGIVEKYYQAIAREFRTDSYLGKLPGARSRVESGFVRELTKAQSDFLRAHGAKRQTGHGMHRLKVTPEQLPAFLADLRALIEKYEAADGQYLFGFLTYPAPERERP